MVEKIKVAVVDDSLFVRTILSDMLSSDPEIEIVGTAKDGIDAIELVKKTEPNVVTMDLVMPRADGLQALEGISKLQKNTSVIMLSAADRASADSVMKSLDLGAFDFVMKPASTSSTDIMRVKWEIITKIKAAFKTGGKRIVEKEHLLSLAPGKEDRKCAVRAGPVIAIGASTGGPVALRYILGSMPALLPAPIVIAQHMPKAFTESFAERLSKKCAIKVIEAKEGEVLTACHAYIAPGEMHMEVIEEGGKLVVELSPGERLHGGRPSADLLLSSVADSVGKNTVGVILTGMGSDGSKGIQRIKQAGGLTIAQDEQSSLVWSMPRAAIRLGAVDHVMPLQDIPRAIINGISGVGA
ncbi:MAG: chemotaxis response regulator protein-glutamate methylesterase [Thermoplasmata archaeon]|nr:chemotaxis response regulator protein-glutamate methylesterase [Thermoplasmata archaeon]